MKYSLKFYYPINNQNINLLNSVALVVIQPVHLVLRNLNIIQWD